MDASKHSAKGLCTSKMEPTHKINDVESRFAKVSTVWESKGLDDIIFVCWRGISSPWKTLFFLLRQIVRKKKSYVWS